MFLLALGTILFILAKAADYFNGVYARMYDGTRISKFVYDYWRTSKALPQFLFAASMLCVWFPARHLEIAQMIAVMLLFLCSLSLMCGVVMCIATPIMLILGEWSLDAVLDRFGDAWRKVRKWRRDWKEDRRDMLGMSLLVSASLCSFAILLWNMTTTVMSDLMK